MSYFERVTLGILWCSSGRGCGSFTVDHFNYSRNVSFSLLAFLFVISEETMLNAGFQTQNNRSRNKHHLQKLKLKLSSRQDMLNHTSSYRLKLNGYKYLQ